MDNPLPTRCFLYRVLVLTNISYKDFYIFQFYFSICVPFTFTAFIFVRAHKKI